MGGREEAMVEGYSTVSRPSPRPPIQMIVFVAVLDGEECSKATSFLVYLWRVPGLAIVWVFEEMVGFEGKSMEEKFKIVRQMQMRVVWEGEKII